MKEKRISDGELDTNIRSVIRNFEGARDKGPTTPRNFRHRPKRARELAAKERRARAEPIIPKEGQNCRAYFAVTRPTNEPVQQKEKWSIVDDEGYCCKRDVVQGTFKWQKGPKKSQKMSCNQSR